MFRHNFIISIRNLLRRKGYTFINVAGLGVGMAVCLLIGLYIEDELSYDRFHEKADRLYVVTGRSLSTPYSLATVLKSVPGVEQTTRCWRGRTITITREEEELRANIQVLLVEPSFFEMFSFPAVAGIPSKSTNAPYEVAITESLAQRLFRSGNPIGKQLQYQRSGPGDKTHSVIIGAVLKDAPPNSSIQFDLIAPISSLGADALRENEWGFDLFETYVQTVNPFPASGFTSGIAKTMKRHMGPNSDLMFSALPLQALHLSGLTVDGLIGQSKFLYFFGTIAIFVLFIAVVNYANIIIVQAAQRKREVGVRKTMGAGHFQLIWQFMGESTLLSFISMIISLLLVMLALPEFGRLFNKELTFQSIEYGFTLPIITVILLLLAVLAGVYPAFILSRFRPAEVLRVTGAKAIPTHTFGLRKSLVVLQFTISSTLIIGTAIIYHQLEYIQNKELGFNGEQVMVVELGRNLPLSFREAFKQRILSHQGVVSVSIANAVPDRFEMGYTKPIAEVAPQSKVNMENLLFRPAVVDPDFIPMLKIQMLAGRNFSADLPADVSHAYVLNKAAVESLGWSPEEAVGKSFKLGTEEAPEGEIIGVADNFHIASLHQAIKPVVLQLHTLSPAGSIPFVLAAKLAPGQIQGAIEHIRHEFKQVAPPGAPFQFTFLDDRFEEMYRSEEQMSHIFTSFAVLAIFIACLGLFGLAAFTSECRTKEIGIRKVMGASVANIIALLNTDFLKPVFIGFLAAIPIAWYTMNNWLEEFAYRIEPGPGLFIQAGFAAILIALAAVSWQSVKAALMNPTESLRSE
jgi:putative ABC transport system permease protein